MRLTNGCDIVFLPRFQRMLETTPAMKQKIFTPGEEGEATIEHLAGIFAAKEAAFKALSLPPGNWQEVEVIHEESGRPKLVLSGHLAKDVEQLDVSISHDGEYALATVVGILKS